MSRYDDCVGLTERAKELVRDFPVREVGHRIMPDGTTVPFERALPARCIRRKKCGVIRFSYNPSVIVATLYRYVLADGRALEEYIQINVPYNGANYYLALRDAASKRPVPESLWTRDELPAGYRSLS